MIAITTLNNEAAVAKTFEKQDQGPGYSKWINSTDESATLHTYLDIKSTVVAPKGAPKRRRALSQLRMLMVDTISGLEEEILVNLTINLPVTLQNLSATQRNDCVAFVRNFASAANIALLARGDV